MKRFIPMTSLAFCTLLAFAPISPAAAQTASPASQAYMAAMSQMQKDTPKDMTGDADVDFARMMIPHHQAANAMSEALLKYGKDRELRNMAQKIIAAQTKEIAKLQAWLKKHGR